MRISLAAFYELLPLKALYIWLLVDIVTSQQCGKDMGSFSRHVSLYFTNGDMYSGMV